MRSKVKEAARELGLDVELKTLAEPTATVQQAANAVGTEVGQIAKSIVFVMDGEPVVVVASGRHRIDRDKVCEALDCAEGRQASADEVRGATGFPIGGVPPIGHGLPVIIDSALLEYDVIYAAGGDANTLFEVAPRELAGSLHALIAPIGE
jgi:prolyl-tRNA editing enzyme YbaK/EbsC (Cys-tRNA(Pro) deacylase)